MRVPIIWFVVLLGQATLVEIVAAELPPFTPGRSEIRFARSPEQSGTDEVKWRLHAQETPPPYDVTKEKFQLLVPTNYSHSTPHGLFIWISAGDSPSVPREWEPVLAARKLIVIGAFKSGNPRNLFDRVRLAVDANYNLRARFNIDGRRVFVSGFSGGARVASMLGVCWADMFSGTMPFMGVNFYTDLPAEPGKTFGLSYLPDEDVLAIAKRACRYVLVTGERDFNRVNSKSAYENGFRKEGFKQVNYLEIPKQTHALPTAKWLEAGLRLLDGEKDAETAGRLPHGNREDLHSKLANEWPVDASEVAVR